MRGRQQIGPDKAHKTQAFERKVHAEAMAARPTTERTTSNVSGISRLPVSRLSKHEAVHQDGHAVNDGG